MQVHLGQDPQAPFYRLDRLRRWGGLQAGTVLPGPVTLFPRIDAGKKPAPGGAAPGPAETAPQMKAEIPLEVFAAVDLRVATVLRAEAVPKARKLLRLEVDLGETRTVVAGIAGAYTPAALVGKQVIIVANLKPTRLMGVESRGMLIAAVGADGPVVATLDKPVAPGTPLR